VKAY